MHDGTDRHINRDAVHSPEPRIVEQVGLVDATDQLLAGIDAVIRLAALQVFAAFGYEFDAVHPGDTIVYRLQTHSGAKPLISRQSGRGFKARCAPFVRCSVTKEGSGVPICSRAKASPEGVALASHLNWNVRGA